MERRPLTICAIGSSNSTHVVSRVKCFADRGHRVFLICDSRAGIEGVTELVAPEALGDQVRFFRALDSASLWLRGRPIWRLRMLSVVLNVARLIRRCRPDIVHVHYAYNPSAWLAMLAGYHPLVVSVMGGDVLFDEQGSPTPSGRIRAFCAASGQPEPEDPAALLQRAPDRRGHATNRRKGPESAPAHH